MSSQPLIKPEHLDGLPGINDENKRQWKQGLAGLWATHNNFPEGSQGRIDAKNKIATASAKIMQTVRDRSNMKSNTAAGGQRPPQPAQGGAQGGQPQAMQQAGAGQNGGQVQQQQQAQQFQQASQGQAQAHAPGQAQQQQMQAMQAKVKSVVAKMQVFPAPNTVNNQQHMAWKETFQHRFGNALLRSERAQYDLTRYTAQLKQMQQQNADITDEMKKKYAALKEAVPAAAEAVRQIEEENNSNRDAYNAKNNRGQNGQAAGNAQANGSQALDTSRPTTQQGQIQGDVKMQQRMSNSPQQAQNQFPQQHQQSQGASTPVQNSTPQQMQQQQQQSQPSAQSQNLATPHSATQSQPPQQNFGQNLGQLPTQNQQRPQMNQQHPSQQPQYSQQQQQQHQQQQQQQQQQYPNAGQTNIPQVPMPNAPNQAQNQRPQPLTQQAAMAQAAQSYAQNNQQNASAAQPQQPQQQQMQQMQQMQQQQANLPNGLPFNNPPQSATQQHTPTSGTGFPPTTTNSQISSSQTKFAIPKELNLDKRNQMPAPGPPARPTFQTGGMMNQPGVQKAPPFTLEGEGDHVLSKRKLDELVRQITGSTSPSDNLSPEVEEAVLSLTDNFVDTVVQKACQLAKLRQGQTLDVRDVQMVLERNYGIRIPGYSLDEVRTVRKFQPAPGWVGKVQAVQAGKVMGGGKDA